MRLFRFKFFLSQKCAFYMKRAWWKLYTRQLVQDQVSHIFELNIFLQHAKKHRVFVKKAYPLFQKTYHGSSSVSPEQISQHVFNIDELSASDSNESMKFIQHLGASTTYNPPFTKPVVYREKGTDRHAVWKHAMAMINESVKYPSLMVAIGNYFWDADSTLRSE